jgi:hypothetical protein
MRLESRVLLAVLPIPFGVASESAGCPVLPDEELRISASFAAVGDLGGLGLEPDRGGFAVLGRFLPSGRRVGKSTERNV